MWIVDCEDRSDSKLVWAGLLPSSVFLPTPHKQIEQKWKEYFIWENKNCYFMWPVDVCLQWFGSLVCSLTLFFTFGLLKNDRCCCRRWQGGVDREAAARALRMERTSARWRGSQAQYYSQYPNWEGDFELCKFPSLFLALFTAGVQSKSQPRWQLVENELQISSIMPELAAESKHFSVWIGGDAVPAH